MKFDIVCLLGNVFDVLKIKFMILLWNFELILFINLEVRKIIEWYMVKKRKIFLIIKLNFLILYLLGRFLFSRNVIFLDFIFMVFFKFFILYSWNFKYVLVEGLDIWYLVNWSLYGKNCKLVLLLKCLYNFFIYNLFYKSIK